MEAYKNLFSPIKVGKHLYKNRIVAAPIYCGTFVNIPGLSFILDHAMKARARGGAAQITIGETPVDFEGASREPFPPIDYSNLNDPAFAVFKELVEQIHLNGAIAMIELSHCGESVEKIPGVAFAIGPMGYIREDGMVVVSMDEQKMQQVTEHFIQAAKFMQSAGFDGVLIHCGHGWLLHQFLSARTNQRTDQYGGILSNRARFPLQLLKSVREAMGSDFILEIRVSGDECMENGMGIDETVAFCKMAEQYIDLIHMSVGVYRNPILSGEFSSLFHPHGLNADMAAAVKSAVSIPVTVVGGINDPLLAEELIASGKCDFVALGRQLTADPDFPNKARNGNEKDINPCLRCFKCFPGPLEGVIDDLTKLFGCSVNPEEFFFDVDLLKSKPVAQRKVLVIGGGIAGMQAAVTAADRGHLVTLVEKSGKLGGLLRFTDTDSYKQDLKSFRDVLIHRLHERNIPVELNKELKPQDISAYGADAVIIAIGSTPVRPHIAGIENALHALDVYDNEELAGKRIVMVGGGLVGCETGLHLAKRGREVTIIEMMDRLAADSYPMHRLGLMNELDHLVTSHIGLKVTRIHKNSVTAMDAEGMEHVFDADTVVYALGMAACSNQAEELKAAAGTAAYEIGDCVKAAKVFEACRQAFIAAYSIT